MLHFKPSSVIAHATKWCFTMNLHEGNKVAPKEDFFKLNIDGASKCNLGRAFAGGIIRDQEGHWIIGFTRNIGATSSLVTKFWALRDGLKLAFDRNIKET
ncbi:hypothetical protein ACSBR1_035940 [Camellia fascicularis]